MKSCSIIFFLSFFFLSSSINAQKALSEGTLVYNMSVETGSGEPKMADMLDGATTTIYLKGNESRSELVSSLGREATIFNASTGKGVMLKDYSGQKLMITLTAKNWEENNKKYEGIVFNNTSETMKISGFNCKKAIAKLNNGTSFIVFYTTDVTVANKSYDAQFKTLPGLPVQYEMQSGKMKLKFTLASISYNSVPTSMFEIPTSGYRVLTYEETKAK
jgi:GLPGLI family protein